MHNLYNELKEEIISLAYFGVFTDKITSLLVNISEAQVSKTDNLRKLSKKASYLVAESFQNIIRHSIDEKENINDIQFSKDFFQMVILQDRVVIITANALENKLIPKISSNVDYINSLNEDELRKLYFNVLTEGTLSSKGGAGLGIIDMVRKSGLPLRKHFLHLNSDYSLLLFSLEIPLNKEVREHKIDLLKTEELYKDLVKKGILLLYKGDFSSTSSTNLIEILSNNFFGEGEIQPENVKKIITIIEVIQNVSKHGKMIKTNKEGIFTLSYIRGDFFIECGNFVTIEDHSILNKILKEIKSSSLEEIETIYKEKLGSSINKDDDNGGLGLLEIARFTKNTFTYSFAETQDNEIFYSIKIKT